MKAALIISGGEFDTYLPKTEYDLVIACDKGYEYANKLEITPDIILGDFDSIDNSIYNNYLKDEAKNIIKHPIEKDDTDTMLAIKKAIELGFTDITIICALGNRLDHTISNIQSMHYATTHGANCEIISSTEQLRTVKGPATFELDGDTPKNAFSLSLFSLTDKCTNLSITGAKYNVSSITLTNNFPLGLGNSFVDDKIFISFDYGTLLIVKSKM